MTSTRRLIVYKKTLSEAVSDPATLKGPVRGCHTSVETKGSIKIKPVAKRSELGSVSSCIKARIQLAWS
jgi:hypothetical protein